MNTTNPTPETTTATAFQNAQASAAVDWLPALLAALPVVLPLASSFLDDRAERQKRDEELRITQTIDFAGVFETFRAARSAGLGVTDALFSLAFEGAGYGSFHEYMKAKIAADAATARDDDMGADLDDADEDLDDELACAACAEPDKTDRHTCAIEARGRLLEELLAKAAQRV